MKKIAMLLAALLVFGILAGCNAEEEKTPDHVVPGYSINLYTGDGWTVAEESEYDLQLSKDGVTMFVMGFTVMDFVDMPSAADLYLDCNEELFEEMTKVSVKEKESSYEKDGKKIISTLFSAKSGDETKQYYCFAVDFDDEAESVAWVCFSATEKVMNKQKKSLKTIVEEMEANGKYISPEELEEELEEALSGEDIEEVIEDDYVDEATPTDGESEDVPVTEGSALDEDPGTTEPLLEEEGSAKGTEPEETKPAETTADTKPADGESAPDASAETTASTGATE